MSHLIVEILIRLSKVAAAAILGLIIYGLLTGPLAVAASAELALLSWLSGAAVILLAESSPI